MLERREWKGWVKWNTLIHWGSNEINLIFNEIIFGNLHWTNIIKNFALKEGAI